MTVSFEEFSPTHDFFDEFLFKQRMGVCIDWFNVQDEAQRSVRDRVL